MIRVRAHVNVAGLSAGQEYELPEDWPGLAGAIHAGLVVDLTPAPPKRSRRRSGTLTGDGSGEALPEIPEAAFPPGATDLPADGTTPDANPD